MLLRQHCPDYPVFCRLQLDLAGLTQCDGRVAVPHFGIGGE
jgi:hypothetical protein